MSNIVPEDRGSANLPTALPAPTERGLHCAVNRLVPPLSPSCTRYSLAASDAPSPSLRTALEVRRDRIERWLMPAGADAAAEVYADLVANLAMGGSDKETELRELRGWIEATSPLPWFALKATADAFRDGKVGDGTWMPRPGAFCQEARRRVEGLAREKREITSVLTAEITAPVADPARKAANLARAMAFVAEGREMDRIAGLAKRDPEAERKAKVDAEALRLCIESGKPDSRPLPPLSPYLRKQLGLPDEMPGTVPDRVPDLPPRDYGDEAA